MVDSKVVVITGGASGIGRAVAELFAADGAAVVVGDVDVQGGEDTVETVEALGGEGTFVEADVRDESQIATLISETVDEYGPLDAAFNSAGVGGHKTETAELSAADWTDVIDVNLTGTWHSLKHELAQFKRQESGGAIVNAASVAGHAGIANGPSYVASKHGVVGLTRTAALEHPNHVRVNAVAPGYIDTPMLQQGMEEADEGRYEEVTSKHPMGRLGTAEEVAALVHWLCSEDASFVTGQSYPVDGGYLTP
jgi:NAD(P)-dependent dehydrogenase (short-subunit alcohol dehydrogenase family)